MCVCNCVSRSSCMYSLQPRQTPASFSCPSCMDGYHTTVHQTFSFTYTSCHCSLSLSLFPFVIIRWQKRCRLSASHWLLDIESGKGRGVPSRPCTSPSFFCLAARRRCCRRRWLCTRVSTCAVSFPVHHCAGEADDWIQSAG